MNWILLTQIAYTLLIIFMILRVLYDTGSSTKALAYILFIIFVPIFGMIFYFSFGIKYRKRKLYSKKTLKDEPFRQRLLKSSNAYSEAISIAEKPELLVEYIRRSGNSMLAAYNDVKLFVNGQEKFIELLKALKNATLHIHMEYYIYENDVTGNQVADLLKKTKQGVEVCFMYDDFGSLSLRNVFIKKLNDAGIQTASFNKIKWYAFANRINY